MPSTDYCVCVLEYMLMMRSLPVTRTSHRGHARGSSNPDVSARCACLTGRSSRDSRLACVPPFPCSRNPGGNWEIDFLLTKNFTATDLHCKVSRAKKVAKRRQLSTFPWAPSPLPRPLLLPPLPPFTGQCAIAGGRAVPRAHASVRS